MDGIETVATAAKGGRMRPSVVLITGVGLLTSLPQTALASSPEIAYMVSGTQRSIVVMDSDGSNKTEVYRPPKFSPYNLRPSWSPDGNWLTFTDQGCLCRAPVPGLTLFPEGCDLGSSEGQLSYLGGPVEAYSGIHEPAWSPTGLEIAVRTGEPETIAVFPWALDWSDNPVLEAIYRPPPGHSSDGLTWGPSGLEIALFEEDAAGSRDLIVIDRVAGAVMERISASDVGAPPDWGDPDWSRDGEQISFVAGEGGQATIYTLNLLDYQVEAVAEGISPSWSPDDSQIALRQFPGKIKVYTFFTGGLVNLGSGNWPDWRRVSPPPCTVHDDCNDGNVCTDDACIAGVCDHSPNSATCDDGDFCTVDDVCTEGQCMGNPDPTCCTPTHSKEKGPRCSDGLDNDCDDLIDGLDPDCY